MTQSGTNPTWAELACGLKTEEDMVQLADAAVAAGRCSEATAKVVMEVFKGSEEGAARIQVEDSLRAALRAMDPARIVGLLFLAATQATKVWFQDVPEDYWAPVRMVARAWGGWKAGIGSPAWRDEWADDWDEAEERADEFAEDSSRLQACLSVMSQTGLVLAPGEELQAHGLSLFPYLIEFPRQRTELLLAAIGDLLGFPDALDVPEPPAFQ